MPRAHNTSAPPSPREVAALERLELRLSDPGLTFADSVQVLKDTKPRPDEDTLTGMKLVHLLHIGGSGFAPVTTSLDALKEARRSIENSPSFQDIGLRTVSDAMGALSRRALVDPSLYPVAKEAAGTAHELRTADPTADSAELSLTARRWLDVCNDPERAAWCEIADPVERTRLARLEEELNQPGQTPSGAMRSLIYFEPRPEHGHSMQQKIDRIVALSSYTGILPATALEGLQNAHFEIDFGPRVKPAARDNLADAFTALARRTEREEAKYPGIAAEAARHARDCRAGIKMRWFDPSCGGC